jgi:SnoaL-like polyketide cyclase
MVRLVLSPLGGKTMTPTVSLLHTEIVGFDSADPLGCIAAVESFYSFWDTADAAYLDTAIAPSFVDHNHIGRAPGSKGQADAATAFHAQVPNFHITLDRVIVAHPFVTVQGRGLENGNTAFQFTDVLKMDYGHFITDNWPLEGPNVVTNH